MDWPEIVRHRVVGQGRLAEVAVEHVIEVEGVPHRQRLVEAVVLVERLHRGRVACGLLAEVRGGGVARDELGQDERDERDADQQQDERGEAAGEEDQEAAERERRRRLPLAR